LTFTHADVRIFIAKQLNTAMRKFFTGDTNRAYFTLFSFSAMYFACQELFGDVRVLMRATLTVAFFSAQKTGGKTNAQM